MAIEEQLQPNQIADEYNNEAEWRMRNKKLENGLANLLNSAIVNSEKYGDDDYRTQFSMLFLELALQMKDVIGVMESMKDALGYLDVAVEFIDATVSFADQVFIGTLTQEYGLFARLRRYFIKKKAIRNNTRRMKAAMDRVLDTFTFAEEMIASLQKAMGKLKIRMDKRNTKNRLKYEKKSKKGDGSAGGLVVSSAAQQLIAEEKARRSGNPIPTTGTNASGGAGSDISDVYM